MTRPNSTPRAQAPIGVFDSGLGGLTVAAAVARTLPYEPLCYLGDTARVPYGSRSPATVVRYARNNVAFLKKRGVKLIVVACNTVSAQGLGGLADGSAIPILGVIRPGAKAALAASNGGEIAVLGTRATVRSNAYQLAIHELDPTRMVRQIACPLLVPLVEEGWQDHPVTRQVATEYLAPLGGTAVDTIVLGCTHYPLLGSVLGEVATSILGRDVRIVDAAQAVAEAAARLLDEAGLIHPQRVLGTREFYVTDEPDTVGPIAARFWGDAVAESAPQLIHVDVTDAS